MSAAARLLDRLAALGVTLHADGGRLRFRAPKGVMSPDLIADVRALEADVLRHLGTRTSAIPLVADAAGYDLSHAQRRLWVLHELDPGTAAYHIPLVHRLDGPVDVGAMRRACDALVTRHEALRTSLVTEAGVARQRIAVSGESWLTVTDVSATADPESAAMAEARRVVAAPFDLARAPLGRAVLIRLAPDRHVLCVVLHHLIADGVSIAVLMEDLAAAYASACAGRSDPDQQRVVQYRDCAAWQNHYLASGEAEAHRQYWLGKLAPPLARLDLATDQRRPAVASAEGAEELIAIDRETVDALRRVCRDHRATLFMGLVAAVKVLLHRYTGATDVVVGTPVAGRDHVEAERVVGVFINTLVLRDTIASAMTFAEVLASVRRTSAEAMDHAAYPFDRLVQDIDTARDPSRSPVFDVLVILQSQQGGELALDGLVVSSCYEHTGTSKFDVTVNFHESDAGLSVGIEYRTALFGRARVQRLGRHLGLLLQAIIQRPQVPIGELDMLPDGERARVLHDWNATERRWPLDRTVIDLIDMQVHRHPDAVAVACGAQTVSYGELARRSAQVAAGLAARGIGPGAVVAVYLDRSVNLVVALLGILRTGAAYCPLDPLYPAERLQGQLRDAGTRLLVSERALEHRLPPGSPDVVWVDACAAEPDDRGPSRAEADGLAYLIYTSGSTGAPKVVQVTHRNLTNLLLSMAEAPGIAPQDVWLAVTSLSFDIAGLELYLPLMTGARLVIATADEVRDGARLAERLVACGATIMQGTPATWRLLVTAGWRGSPSFTALCGGELLPDGLAAALLDRAGAVWNLYGPTETTIWSLLHRVARSGAHPHAGVPIGRPIANTGAYILDRHGAPMPQGYPGDLFLGGTGVSRGYWHRPDLTADRFAPNPYGERGDRLYRTGDRAVALEDGAIQFLGRDDHQVKIRGFRVELGEIEEALASHADVVEAVVTAAGEPGDDRSLVAFVVVRAGRTFDPDTLRAHLAGLLPPHAVPSLVTRLDRLPLTPNGKVDRGALPRPDRQSATTALAVAPRTERERAIQGVFASVLELDGLSIHDNFFALGGHSLRATRATYLLQAALGIDVTLIDIFKAPTVAELADRLRDRRPDEAMAIPPGPGPGRPATAAPTRTGPMTPEEAQLLREL